MRLSKILVPTDFSPSSQEALALAEVMARESGAEILIVHAQEQPVAYGSGELYYGLAEPDNEHIRAMLEEVHPADTNIRHEHHLLSGDVAYALTQFAEQEGVDLIVMGTHGRSGISRILMGSIAEAVVRNASCPVLTIKQPAEKMVR